MMTLDKKIEKIKKDQKELMGRLKTFIRFSYDPDLEISMYAPKTESKLVLNRKCDEIDAFEWVKTYLGEFIKTLENQQHFNKRVLDVLVTEQQDQK